MPAAAVNVNPAVTYSGTAPVNANGMQPRVGTTRRNQPLSANPASPWGVGQTSFSGTNNLIGSQIGPGESAGTQNATRNASAAQNALSGFQFSQYQPTATADYSQANGLLLDANAQSQGAQYNYGAGNAQRDAAGTALAGARNAASPFLQNAGSMGLSSYTGGAGSGGAAAVADKTGLLRGLDESNALIGPAFADAADTQRARALTAQQLEKSMSAPDRQALGAENLALYEERSQPAYQASLRAANASNAAMGRKGSGMVTSELSDISATRERDLAQQRRQLAADAAGLTLSDNLNLTNAGLGVTQGFGAEDRAGAGVRLGQAGQRASNANSDFNANATNAGFQNDAYNRMEQAAGRQAQGAQAYAQNQRNVGNDFYNMGADESTRLTGYGNSLDTQENNRVKLIGDQAGFQRNTANDVAANAQSDYNNRAEQGQRTRKDEYDQFGATNTRANNLTGYQTQERNYDASNRDEVRGERDYQYGLNRDAIGDEERRAQFEETLRNGRYQRALGTYNAGQQAPQPDYGAQAANAQNQANGWNQAAGQAAATVGYNAQRRTGAGSGARSNPAPYGYDSNGEPLTAPNRGY